MRRGRGNGLAGRPGTAGIIVRGGSRSSGKLEKCYERHRSHRNVGGLLLLS